MKIAIAGAGVTGAYLYQRIKNQGHEIAIFDLDPKTRCGLSPCAWGTSRGFAELVRASGFDPEKYTLGRFNYVVMDDLRVPADLLTCDKPALLRDWLQGAKIQYAPLDPARYDRIIDATGVARAFLPAIQDDLVLPCFQARLGTQSERENRVRLRSIGYAWCFPLGPQEYHVGCGSLIADPQKIMRELNWIGTPPHRPSSKIICTCRGKVRITAPEFSQPFYRPNGKGGVWGVGEAIGCVAPLAGDGIVPGMKSVELLLEWWDDPEAYTQAILKEFHWMSRERKVLDKIRRNESLGLADAWVLRKNSRRMGMQIGVRDALRLLKKLR